MKKASTILIVDDEPKILKLYSDTLEGAGYDVLSAGNGQDALRLAQEQKPDLILLDVKMPVMDGVEVFERLQGDERTKGIKVVFVSAFGDPNVLETDVKSAKEIGAHDYLRKGLSLHELVLRVKKYLA